MLIWAGLAQHTSLKDGWLVCISIHDGNLLNGMEDLLNGIIVANFYSFGFNGTHLVKTKPGFQPLFKHFFCYNRTTKMNEAAGIIARKYLHSVAPKLKQQWLTFCPKKFYFQLFVSAVIWLKVLLSHGKMMLSFNECNNTSAFSFFKQYSVVCGLEQSQRKNYFPLLFIMSLYNKQK